MPQVDVIVPFFNTPLDFMEAALRSIVAQSVTDWRAVVVNDGSSAASTGELQKLLAQLDDDRITSVASENHGLPAARNLGMRSSDSPCVALLDSDDVWYPHRLRVGLAALDSDPDIDLVHADTDLIQPDGSVVKARPRSEDLDRLSQKQLFERLLANNCISVPTTLFRRTAVVEAGLFDETFTAVEDKELWLRMLLFGKRMRHLDSVVAQYRLHASNMSKSIERMAGARQRLIEKLDGLLVQKPLLSAGEWQARRRQMRHHLHHELAEGWLEKSQPWTALKYTLPIYSGVSAYSTRLAARAVYRGVAGSLGLHRRPA